MDMQQTTEDEANKTNKNWLSNSTQSRMQTYKNFLILLINFRGDFFTKKKKTSGEIFSEIFLTKW